MRREWLVVSLVADASFGPFTEAEAKAFIRRSGYSQSYGMFRTRDLAADVHSAVRYGLA